MRIADFKADPQTQQFARWLSKLIDSSYPLDFQYAPGRRYRKLSDARDAYAWPRGASTILTPEGGLVLAARSDLAANEVVLDKLSKGLRNCLASPELEPDVLAGWVEAVLRWGGVYRRQRGSGNAGWLDDRRAAGDLRDTLTVAMNAFAEGAIHIDEAPASLRSNAGLTKVYSLTLDDFIIYDSRVAGALAWLVKRWGQEAGGIPPHLRFICMPPSEGPNVAAAEKKVRSPDKLTFPLLRGSDQRAHRKHAMWNLRANHLLTAALGLACRRPGDAAPAGFRTVRHVEAALFVMGYDLRHDLL